VLNSVQAFVAACKRDTLHFRFQDERRLLKAALKSSDVAIRRDWISHHAEAGDKAAMAAPHQIRFRARGERRSKSPRIEIGTVTGTGEVREPLHESIRWVADARGVDYRIKHTTLFRDEGRRVVFCSVGDDVVRAGLMLCREKWARGLYISGTDEFKSKVRQMATTMHIRIADPTSEHPAPSLEAETIWPASAINPSAANVTINGFEHLFCKFGKPIVATELRVGRQHTGRIIDAKRGAGHTGIVVMDVGRELAIIRTDAQTAGQMKADVGRRMTARAASTETDSKRFGWQFVKVRGIESILEHSR
jgi:hypothetical protein